MNLVYDNVSITLTSFVSYNEKKKKKMCMIKMAVKVIDTLSLTKGILCEVNVDS